MKNLLNKLLLVTLCFVLLVGCSKVNDNKPQPITPPVEEQIEAPDVEPIIRKSFTDYFKANVDAEFISKNNYLIDFNHKTISFKQALNRQLQLVTNDILYRLFAIYGSGANITDNQFASYYLTYNNEKFSLENNYAKVVNHSIIEKPFKIENDKVFYLNFQELQNNIYDLSQVSTYAYLLQTGYWNTDNLFSKHFLNANAINGGYVWINEENGFDTTNLINKDLAWKWNYENLSITSKTNSKEAFEIYYNAFYNNLLTAVANAIVNDGKTYDYDTALCKITRLGFNESDKQNILNFIYNDVIGLKLINFDNQQKESIFEKTNGILTQKNFTELSVSEHYYRAYQLIIPQIIESAFNNTFNNTTTSLYLTENLYKTETVNIGYNALFNKNFSKVKIYPKDNEIPLTKLIITFNITEIEIKYNIYLSSEEHLTTNKFVTDDKTVILDFSQYKNYKLTETGYIEFIITPSCYVNYNLTFDGYYNKV